VIVLPRHVSELASAPMRCVALRGAVIWRADEYALEDIMNKKTLALVACFAWAAAALSTAAPANAEAVTTQSGSYATCSGTYTTASSNAACGAETVQYHMSYQQNMKFISTTCGTGGCSSDSLTVATDTVYGTGRKHTYFELSCIGGKRLYSITTCAC
jgi:hypothetical protein